MTNESDTRPAELAELTADIVSAYVSNNPLPVSGLPDMIASVHASLSGLGTPIPPVAEPQTPAVNPKRSVTPDFIICLEDGKKFKSLKRHLSTKAIRHQAKQLRPVDLCEGRGDFSAICQPIKKASSFGDALDMQCNTKSPRHPILAGRQIIAQKMIITNPEVGKPNHFGRTASRSGRQRDVFGVTVGVHDFDFAP
jgi:hypothetical protein